MNDKKESLDVKRAAYRKWLVPQSFNLLIEL